jgi:hypothetical protein
LGVAPLLAEPLVAPAVLVELLLPQPAAAMASPANRPTQRVSLDFNTVAPLLSNMMFLSRFCNLL